MIEDIPLPPAWENQDPLLPYPGYFSDAPQEWMRTHGAHKSTAQAGADTIRAVFLGDSITQGWDKALWNSHFASRGAVNFAIGGDKTCQVLWRVADGLLDGLTPDVIVLAIGVNNIWSERYTGEHIARGVGGCVAAIQAKCPDAKILLSAVLPCMESPVHPYRAVIREINHHVARLADGGRIRYVDAGPALLEPDGTLPLSIAPDGVHLSQAGYKRFATALAPAFDAIRS